MKSFQGKAYLPVYGVLVILVVSAGGSFEKGITDAFNSLGSAERIALNALAPSFLTNLIAVAKCIGEKAKPINPCDFKTSYDPLYYLSECAQNTTIGTLIQNFIASIPTTKIPYGIPPTVSKDRCFKLIPDVVPTLPPFPLGK